MDTNAFRIPADDLLHIRTDARVAKTITALLDHMHIAINSCHDESEQKKVVAAGNIIGNLVTLAQSPPDSIIKRAQFSDKRAIGWALDIAQEHDPDLGADISHVRSALGVKANAGQLPRHLSRLLEEAPAPGHAVS